MEEVEQEELSTFIGKKQNEAFVMTIRDRETALNDDSSDQGIYIFNGTVITLYSKRILVCKEGVVGRYLAFLDEDGKLEPDLIQGGCDDRNDGTFSVPRRRDE